MSAAPPRPAERLAQARALVDAGDLDGASTVCAEVIEAHPDHAAAHHLLGFVELGRERPAEAVRAFEAALRHAVIAQVNLVRVESLFFRRSSSYSWHFSFLIW